MAQQEHIAISTRRYAGKSYTFQVRFIDYNFSAKHQTLTVSRIMEEGERLPLPEFVTDKFLATFNNMCVRFRRRATMVLEMTSLSTKVCVGGDEKQKGPTLETTSIGLITKKSHGTSSSKFTKKVHIA
ncbi:hypothetical protein Bca4012_065160 [Brassica carinata]